MYFTKTQVRLNDKEEPYELGVAVDDKEGEYIKISDLKALIQQARIKVLGDESLIITYRDTFAQITEWELDVFEEIIANFKR